MGVKTHPPHTMTEPVAPVVGGLHWRTPYFGVIDLFRKPRNASVCGSDDAPEKKAPSLSEPEATTAPHILSVPLRETSAREEYVYQPRAYDSNCTGFTWYLQKGPPHMRVDRSSGKLTWTPSKGGYVEIILCVRNVYGGTARQSWRLCIRKAPVIHIPVINTRFTEALKRKSAHTPLPAPIFWRKEGRRTGPRSLPATAPPVERFRADIPLRM